MNAEDDPTQRPAEQEAARGQEDMSGADAPDMNAADALNAEAMRVEVQEAADSADAPDMNAAGAA